MPTKSFEETIAREAERLNLEPTALEEETRKEIMAQAARKIAEQVVNGAGAPPTPRPGKAPNTSAVFGKRRGIGKGR